jgi:hypothetical protein
LYDSNTIATSIGVVWLEETRDAGRLRVAFYNGQLPWRGRHDVIHRNQPLLMEFHIKKLLQDRFNQFGMEEKCSQIQAHRQGSTIICEMQGIVIN